MGGGGLLLWLAICSSEYSPSKLVTTHLFAFRLPKFGGISDLLSLSASFFLGAFLFCDCQSERYYIVDLGQMAWA